MLFLRTLAPTILLSLGLAGCSGDAVEPAAAEPTLDATEELDPVVAAHVEVVRRRIEANNAQDWDTWESLHVEGAVRTAPELTEPLQSAQAMRASIEELVRTFPDYHLQLVDAFGSRNRLVARIRTKATMLGSLGLGGATIPPTGKVFEQDWVAVLCFEGNRISSIDEFHDNHGILVQLGLSGGE